MKIWKISGKAPIGVANTINWAKKYLQNAARMSKDIDEEPRQALLARVVNDLVKASFKQVKKVRNNLYIPSCRVVELIIILFRFLECFLDSHR